MTLLIFAPNFQKNLTDLLNQIWVMVDWQINDSNDFIINYIFFTRLHWNYKVAAVQTGISFFGRFVQNLDIKLQNWSWKNRPKKEGGSHFTCQAIRTSTDYGRLITRFQILYCPNLYPNSLPNRKFCKMYENLKFLKWISNANHEPGFYSDKFWTDTITKNTLKYLRT